MCRTPWRALTNCTTLPEAEVCSPYQPWPSFDPDLVREDEAELPVQVNGKLRGRIRVPFGAPKELIEQRALADDKIQP